MLYERLGTTVSGGTGMEQIVADIALKRAQTQWEPWAIAAAFGAGATIASAMLASAICVVSRLH